MRQGMEEVSNVYFIFHKPVHTVDGLLVIYYPGFFVFFMFSPLSVTGTPL